MDEWWSGMGGKRWVGNSGYQDTKGWTLVNDYTICEDRKLSDRSYMQTKVPKRLWLNLEDIRAVEAYSWSGGNGIGELAVNDQGELVADGPEEERNAEYVSKHSILARATFDDKITIFSIAEGALLTFDEIAQVRIVPIKGDKIGGRNKATTFYGIGFSGMHSRKVPDKGLMEGEPGRLFLVDDSSPSRGGDEEASLSLELYLDEPQFKELFGNLLAAGETIDAATLNAVIELFESETQASLKEPGMQSEYGLLKFEGRDWVSARARIDGIQVSYSKPRTARASEEALAARSEVGRLESHDNDISFRDEHLAKLVRSVSSRLGWVIALLLMLLLSLLLKS